MRTSLLALLCFLAGCDVMADVPKRDLPTKAREIHDRMHARLAATRRIERSIAFGNLEAAHADAGYVARLDEPDLLPAYRPYVEQIRASARQIELAQDLVAAARTSALLGRRCAQCHEASSAKVVFATEAPPAAGVKLPSHMLGHEWAIGRLWEGLVGPSSERWLEGARALTRAPLAIVAEGDGLPPDLAVGDDVARLRLLATRAQAAKTQDDRAALYGDLLALPREDPRSLAGRD